MPWDGYKVTMRYGEAPKPEPIAISEAGLQELAMKLGLGGEPALTPIPRAPVMSAADIFRPYKPPTGFGGPDADALAMDSAARLAEDWDTTISPYVSAVGGAALSQGLGFLGYPFLAELSQRPEYRKISETIAEELTRKWIRITSISKGKDKTDKVDRLNDAVSKFKLRERFQWAGLIDGFMGRSQLYIDVGTTDDPEELKTPLMLEPAKIAKGSLKGFRMVEPMWSYPLDYNSSDPLAENFYVPTSWAVMQRRVHASRLLTFIGRPMPDLLKPAYAFGGLSLSQMAMPYVQNWLRTRQSVSDLIHSFSVMVLATNMGSTLDAEGMNKLIRRVQAAVAFRDNRGLQAIDKNTEEFSNVSAPIAGLHELQAQSQEQMASVAGIPLVKLLGITPSGLNASSDGEVRVFYDRVKATQEKFMDPQLKHALDVIQLHEFGEVDPDLVHEWVPLWELDEAGKAAVRKTDADTGAVLIESGTLDPQEERKRIASAPDSPYQGLDVDDMPEPPDMGEGEEPDIPGAKPKASGNPAKSAEPASVERAGDAELAAALGMDAAALAVDEEHWITVHPNGREHEGQPLLIEGSPGGGYTVKGGAGGKLDGKQVDPKSISKPRGGGGGAPNPPEPPAGYERSAANAKKLSERADRTAQHVNPHLHRSRHEAAYHAHREALQDAGGTSKTDSHHMAEMSRHAGEVRKGAASEAEALGTKANGLSLTAKSEAEHMEAAQAHGRASEAWKEATNWAFRMQSEGSEYEDDKRRQYEHVSAYGRHLAAAQKAGRRSKNKAVRAELANTETGRAKLKADAMFAKHSLPEIERHFADKFGLTIENGSNAVRDYKQAKKALYKGWGGLSAEERQQRQDTLATLREAARGRPGIAVRGHTETDITDGSASAKQARATLGHLHNALSHLESQGFDMRAALKNAPVIFHPGKTGKSIGHAWQEGFRPGSPRRGHLSLSAAKNDAVYEAQQDKFAAERAAAGKPRWTVSSQGGHMQTTAIHELAHAIGMQSHVDSPNKLYAILDSMFPRGSAERHSWIKNTISEYAASNIYETDAELAAMVTSPDYVRGTLPKALEDHVDALFSHRGR